MKNNSGNDDITQEDPLFSIWQRSRVKAYAHNFAAVRLYKKARKSYNREMVASVLALVFLVVGLSVSEDGFGGAILNLTKIKNIDVQIVSFGRVFVFLSVLISFISLYLAITSDSHQTMIMQGRNKFASRQYMAISQKTRRPNSGIFDGHYRDALIFALNDQIETLVAAGENPEDEDYNKAHELMKEVMMGPFPGSSYVNSGKSADIDLARAEIDAEVYKIKQNEEKKSITYPLFYKGLWKMIFGGEWRGWPKKLSG